MIFATGIEKSFRQRPVLRGTDLQVAPGKVTLLLGDNGAGKTTLLRVLVGLTRPDAGEVTLGGKSLSSETAEALGNISFLPQSPQFNPRLKSIQLLRFYASLRKVGEDQVSRVLGLWGLESHAQVSTARLSGGLRQRLALAIFSLAAVPILILDEPGLSLDPIWRERLQAYLSERASSGATVLVATHLLGEWEGHADLGVLLENGRVVRNVAPDELRHVMLHAPSVPSAEDMR
jgi:ABC-2 type transport system ATP-binding protein